jgi:transcription initiation factor TFIID subunit 8
MAEEFSSAVARVAAAQIAEASGFEAVEESAVDMLAELMVRYLSEVGASSHSYAELAGRTDTNAGDVVRTPPTRTASTSQPDRSYDLVLS